jgi:hypothetical protein
MALALRFKALLNCFQPCWSNMKVFVSKRALSADLQADSRTNSLTDLRCASAARRINLLCSGVVRRLILEALNEAMALSPLRSRLLLMAPNVRTAAVPNVRTPCVSVKTMMIEEGRQFVGRTPVC